MNVVFNQFLFSFSKDIVSNIINGLDIEEAFCITTPSGRFSEEEKKRMSCQVHTFDYTDLYLCLYKDVNWDDMEPVDAILLEKMSVYENELMYMMERDIPTYSYYNRSQFDEELVDPILKFNRFKYEFFPLTYLERKRHYERHLKYWNNFYKKNKIDFFITESLPHNTHEYMAYRLAQVHGVKIVMGGYIPGYRRWMVFEDYKKSNPEIPAVFKTLKKTVRIEDMTWEKSSEDEWNRLLKNELPWYTTPSFTNMKTKEREQLYREAQENSVFKFAIPAESVSRVATVKKWLTFTYWLHALSWHTSKEKVQEKLFAYYESLCTIPDYSKKYIYVPLHYQPEVTTAPMGGYYANQLLLVQMLAHYIPEDWLIYIKENPYQENRCRNIEFYQDLVHIDKVRLISRKTNTFELSANCTATASITGTAGWEGLFKGKPYLMFGYFCVQYAPGVFPIRNNEDCRLAIEEIKNGNYSISKDDLKYFIKALELCSVEASPDVDTFMELNINKDVNARKMADAFVDFIKNRLSLK